MKLSYTVQMGLSHRRLFTLVRLYDRPADRASVICFCICTVSHGPNLQKNLGLTQKKLMMKSA